MRRDIFRNEFIESAREADHMIFTCDTGREKIFSLPMHRMRDICATL